VGPAGIPAGIVNKISADTRKALKDPAVRDRLVGLGNDTMDMSPEEFKIFVRSEVQEYARVVKAAGIQPQLMLQPGCASSVSTNGRRSVESRLRRSASPSPKRQTSIHRI